MATGCGPRLTHFLGIPGMVKTLVWWTCLSSAPGGLPQAARRQDEDLREDLLHLPPCREGSHSHLPLLSALGGHIAGLPNVAFIDFHSGSLKEVRLFLRGGPQGNR